MPTVDHRFIMAILFCLPQSFFLPETERTPMSLLALTSSAPFACAAVTGQLSMPHFGQRTKWMQHGQLQCSAVAVSIWVGGVVNKQRLQGAWQRCAP
jgi:hypothetical protein